MAPSIAEIRVRYLFEGWLCCVRVLVARRDAIEGCSGCQTQCAGCQSQADVHPGVMDVVDQGHKVAAVANNGAEAPKSKGGPGRRARRPGPRAHAGRRSPSNPFT